MNFVNQSANFLLELLNNVVWSAFMYAFLSGLTAFILGIILVRRMRKAGVHHRPYQWWQFSVRATYFFIPVRATYFFIPLWLFALGVLQGGLWGGHTAINTMVDEATEPVMDHFAQSLPGFQEFLNTTVIPPGSTAGAIVDMYTESRKDQGMVSRMYNSAVLYSALEMSPKYSGDFLTPINQLASINPRELKRADLDVIPSGIKAFIAMKMAILYWVCLWPFALFFGGLILEKMLHGWLFQSQRQEPQEVYDNVWQVA
jgi:hypothetical protein